MSDFVKPQTDIIANANITVSSDGMTACAVIPPPADPKEKYTASQFINTLRKAGVTTGIMDSAITEIIGKGIYGHPMTIAAGIPVQKGTDGYFTYHFRTELDNKPHVLADGSVDYRSVDVYEPVSRGQVIATYTPATPGSSGVTVRGAVIKALPGKELKPLRGTGFSVSEDQITYTSDMDGKIEYNNGTITITNILDIRGDVDLTSGDIVFDGDVLVHGNVLSGSMIHSDGKLTILGNVESAYIFSEGEMQLKGGMQGGGKGVVECNSDVWGKFFEQSTLRIKGELHANSLLNCNTYVMKNIYVTGKRGVIVGGDTVCIGNIEATIIGNMAEAKTKLSSGMSDVMIHETDTLEKRIIELRGNLAKLKQVLNKINSMDNKGSDQKLISMRKQVTSAIEKLENQLSEATASLNYNLNGISEFSNPRIVARKYLYPGVSITLNGLNYTVRSNLVNVYLKETDGTIEIINNC